MRSKQSVIEGVRLEKFIHGGQAMGQLEDGKKILVWGGLPGEIVSVKVTKKKRSYLEGIVEEVIEPSTDRIEPEEPGSYLSTSPWQMMTFEAENGHKQDILAETFEREDVDVDWDEFLAGEIQFGYRNKIEIGFWGDDDGLHLAHFRRGSHRKQIVDENKLANEAINAAARAVRDELNRLKLWAGDLKTLVLRSNTENRVVGALFVKKRLKMDDFKLPKDITGVVIYYSDPKSPASVLTEELYTFGDIKLSDSISGINITYDVNSFFQVNLPVFELALETIKEALNNRDELPVIDMYSGVGTIGLCVGADTLVESVEDCIKMAKQNATGKDIKVVQAESENALEYITNKSAIVVDPPRAGLHKKVVERILEERPPLFIYLSCNPSTQARDVKLLLEKYKIVKNQGYNFFPRTPHIESLCILEVK